MSSMEFRYCGAALVLLLPWAVLWGSSALKRLQGLAGAQSSLPVTLFDFLYKKV